MASSPAVNVNSALQYISTQSGLPIEIIRGWFPNESNNRGAILNMISAKRILDRMIEVAFRSSFPAVTMPNEAACSVNSFKALYNKAMINRRWNIVEYPYNIGIGNEGVFLGNSLTIDFALKGGGGGGSGGAKTNFDGNGTLTIQPGANGGTTYILKNKQIVASASGGNGGTGQTAQKGVRDGGNGTDGSEGEYKAVSGINFNLGDSLEAYPGYGGGGSGAGALRVTKNNSYSGTVYTPSKNNGGNAGQFGNYDPRCAGGGGAGGSGYDYQNGVFVEIQGSVGLAANSGASDGQNGFSAGDLPYNIVRTISTGGSGGNAGSYATGGNGGSSYSSNKGYGGKSGSTNGYASGGGGGGSGYIEITSYFTPNEVNGKVYFNVI